MKKELFRLIMRIGRLPQICKINYYKALIRGGGYSLSDEVTMYYPQNISIGEGTYINGGYIIASPHARIEIGKDCLISYNVHIRTDTHNYEDRSKPINKQGNKESNIVIGNDVWIGFGVQIMSGVTIADGCVLGAGTVVTKSTEPYGVYAGIPARLIKYRGSED